VAYLTGVLSQGVLDPPVARIFGIGDIFLAIRQNRRRHYSGFPEGIVFEWKEGARITPSAYRSLSQGSRIRLREIAKRLPADGGLGDFLDEQMGTPQVLRSERALLHGVLPKDALAWQDEQQAVWMMNEYVIDEIPMLATRLLGTEPELYTAQDRLESEAELRESLLPPLIALLVIVAATLPAIWIAPIVILGFGLIYLVHRQARASQQARNDLLVDAWFLERVEAPTFERLFNAAGIKRTTRAKAD
jgi:hypothetical protein